MAHTHTHMRARKHMHTHTHTHTPAAESVHPVNPQQIRYHEAFLNGNKLCVVMEYAPFGDLKYYITKGLRLNAKFPEEAIWRIFLQLCQGLSALHSNKVIHRDIKVNIPFTSPHTDTLTPSILQPANIFLCQNDVLKIGDLGVAKALTK
jgi:serine/threonine protein kinase